MEKKIPLRTCVCCRNSYPKQQLIRIVRTPEGEVKVDETGKMNGRGAYVCKEPSCANRMLKAKFLNKIFGVEIPEEVYAYLKEALLG